MFDAGSSLVLKAADIPVKTCGFLAIGGRSGDAGRL